MSRNQLREFFSFCKKFTKMSKCLFFLALNEETPYVVITESAVFIIDAVNYFCTTNILEMFVFPKFK